MPYGNLFSIHLITEPLTLKWQEGKGPLAIQESQTFLSLRNTD